MTDTERRAMVNLACLAGLQLGGQLAGLSSEMRLGMLVGVLVPWGVHGLVGRMGRVQP